MQVEIDEREIGNGGLPRARVCLASEAVPTTSSPSVVRCDSRSIARTISSSTIKTLSGSIASPSAFVKMRVGVSPAEKRAEQPPVTRLTPDRSNRRHVQRGHSRRRRTAARSCALQCQSECPESRSRRRAARAAPRRRVRMSEMRPEHRSKCRTASAARVARSRPRRLASGGSAWDRRSRHERKPPLPSRRRDGHEAPAWFAARHRFDDAIVQPAILSPQCRARRQRCIHQFG